MHKHILVIASLFLIACGSTPPSTSIPTHRLHSPEVANEPFAVNLAIGVGGNSTVVLGRNLTGENTENETGGDLIIRLDMTILPGLNIITSADVNEGTAHVTTLYQFAGDRSEQATTGSTSQAVSLGYMTTNNSGRYTSEADILLSINGVDTRSSSHDWDQKTKAIDVAWIFGYRTSPKLLIFGDPFVQFLQAEVNSTSNIRDHKDDGLLMGADLAFEYRIYSGFSFTGEVVFYENDWE